MPNGTPFPVCQWELGPVTHDLAMKLSASFWEDEKGTIPAPSVVFASETYFVKIEWSLEGHLARHFCGKWQVKIDLESIGPAPEYSSPLEVIDMVPCKVDPYTHTFALTAGTLKPDPGGTVYLVVATLSSLDPCGDPGHIWGYCEGPSVMFVP